ncbi:MAG: hypothetical protein KJ749_13085, partial [Planctomycetes bacterium]|nr:hypothetical protein [Planctomycetota bacterium]
SRAGPFAGARLMFSSHVFGYWGDYVFWWVLLLSLFVHTWCFFKFFPWKKRRKTGLVAGNTLILFCLLGIAAMVGETYLRFVYVGTDVFGASLPARRWFALHTKLNSFGCRDVEWIPHKPENVRRIAFVGDSFAYGWGIERVENRFTEQIAARFDRRSPGSVEVMNVTKPGWGTAAQLTPVKDLVDRFQVDEVVLCYVLNDIEPLLPVSEDFNPLQPPDPVILDPDRSCLFDYLYRTFWIPRVPAVRGYRDWLVAGFANEEIWLHHQRQLGEIVQYCRSRGVVFRVALLPFLHLTGGEFPARELHAQVREFFDRIGVDTLDLLPTVAGRAAGELIVNRRDPHPNELAHQLFAQAIWDRFYAEPTD